MFDHLQIDNRRERTVVGAADVALRLAGPVARAARRRAASPPGRILLLRLERIGDLLMTLEAIADVRQAAPGALIDLVAGSWNADLARRIPGIHRVETLDAAWLAREVDGLPLTSLLRHAAAWRGRSYDLAINFEPDIRSNLLVAASRAAQTAGFASGGGGALLDIALTYQPKAHTSANARRLVAAALDVPPRATSARLDLTPDDRRAAAMIAGRRRPLVGMHVGAGRLVKQWAPDRFAELASRLITTRGATVALTGSVADRPLVDRVLGLEPAAVDLSGALDLPSLAAVLEEADVLVTGDTGPMHLAAAVGTPVVAIFGPSEPVRYAPVHPMHRVVRIDLPCSPCNRIRLPPARCAGHIPDCLTGIDVDSVYRAVEDALDGTAQPRIVSGAGRR